MSHDLKKAALTNPNETGNDKMKMTAEEKAIRLVEAQKEYDDLVSIAREKTEMLWGDAGDGDGLRMELNSIDEQLAELNDEIQFLKPEPIVKFMYNGIKVDGKLYKGWYSKGSYHQDSKIPAGTITIYARD